jgi:hypothetical protein
MFEESKEGYRDGGMVALSETARRAGTHLSP